MMSSTPSTVIRAISVPTLFVKKLYLYQRMESVTETLPDWESLVNFYDHLTLHIIPGPRSLSYFIFILLLHGALLIPPSVLSHRQLSIIFLPLIVACEVHAWEVSGVLDVISTTVLQWSLVLLCCYDPRNDFKRVWWAKPIHHLRENGDVKVNDAKKDALIVHEQAYPEKFVDRIPWVSTLLVSIRLSGWKTGDPHHDKTQPLPRTMSRTAFFKLATSTFLLNYILLDISAYYACTDPYFTTSFMSVDAPLIRLSTSAGSGDTVFKVVQKLPPRIVRSGVLAAHIYGLVAGGFYPATFPVLGLNALGIIPDEWSPHTWPIFFGSFSVVGERGLRGLWGSWWHQMNRQINATPGRALADIMGLHRTSFLSKMIVTMIAFGFSGWMHMGMIPPEPLSTLVTPLAMRMNVAAFFWAQPVGFAVEYAVVGILDRFAPQAKDWPMAKPVVLLWVSAWLCLTLPFLTVPFREIGYWNVYPIPVSIIHGLLGHGWRVW